MRSKSQTAREMAANFATLVQEADDPQEREYYARLRDAWTTLARRCEPFDFPDGYGFGRSDQTRTPPQSEVTGGASEIPHLVGRTKGYATRAPFRKLAGRAKGSSRNFRHKQPVGHALLEVPDHCRLGSRD